MAVRAPHLYRSLRCFCLAGFSLLAADVEAGAEIPFSFEEHAARGTRRCTSTGRSFAHTSTRVPSG